MNTHSDSPLAAAARLLSLRAMSAKELKVALLRKGFSVGVVQETVDSLSEQGLVNDSLYAEQLLHRYIRQGYGRPVIAAKMRERGLEDEVIRDALREFAVEERILYTLAAKYLRRNCSSDGQRRALAALVRRGFSVNDCREAVRQVLAEQSSDTETGCETGDFSEDFTESV